MEEVCKKRFGGKTCQSCDHCDEYFVTYFALVSVLYTMRAKQHYTNTQKHLAFETEFKLINENDMDQIQTYNHTNLLESP